MRGENSLIQVLSMDWVPYLESNCVLVLPTVGSAPTSSNSGIGRGNQISIILLQFVSIQSKAIAIKNNTRKLALTELIALLRIANVVAGGGWLATTTLRHTKMSVSEPRTLYKTEIDMTNESILSSTGNMVQSYNNIGQTGHV